MSTKAKLLELAEETFKEIQRVESAYQDAERRRNATPQRFGYVDADYNAKAMRAEADYLAAKDAYNKMRFNLPDATRSKLAALRREYAQEIGQSFGVDPAQIDAGAIELLKSGIMKPAEYAHMMKTAQAAGNSTMIRLIAKYAAEAADAAAKKYGVGDQRAAILQALAYEGNTDPGAAVMQNFDAVADIITRCTNNSGMIKHWDELAGPLLKSME